MREGTIQEFLHPKPYPSFLTSIHPRNPPSPRADTFSLLSFLPHVVRRTLSGRKAKPPLCFPSKNGARGKSGHRIDISIRA